MSTVIVLPSKQVAEIITVKFDFLSMLAIGESISTATVASVVASGEDASPDAMILGSAVVTGSIVTQKIQGGLVGVIYGLSCSITTSLGQTLIMQARLAITAANIFA